MTKPKARTEGLVVENVEDGLFVIDEERKSAHHLQSPAACVWKHADGQRSEAELAEVLRAELGAESAPELVRLSLDMLGRAHLLVGETDRAPRLDHVTRRQLLAAVGLTTAALVTSISLPAEAQIGSGAGEA